MAEKLTKVCLFCKHMRIVPGDYGYSEYTPGYSAVIDCLKEHWTIDSYDDGVPEYRQCILMALKCEDFDLSPDVDPSRIV